MTTVQPRPVHPALPPQLERPPRPLRALFASELRLLLREPAVALWSAILPIAAMLVLSLVPATREPQEVLDGISFAEAYMPTLILFAITVLALQMQPMTTATYRELGVLKRLRTTPASPWALLGATASLVVLLAVVLSLVLTAIPFATGLGPPQNPIGFILSILLATGSLVGLGALVTAIVPNARVTGGIGWVLSAIVWFSAGMWVPRALFPEWLVAITDSLPGGAAASALLDTAAGGWPSPWVLIVLVAWGVAGIWVAARTFRFE